MLQKRMTPRRTKLSQLWTEYIVKVDRNIFINLFRIDFIHQIDSSLGLFCIKS